MPEFLKRRLYPLLKIRSTLLGEPNGSLLSVFFTRRRWWISRQQKSDTAMFAKYFAGTLEQGIYTAPSQFEAMFVSAAHSAEEIEATVKAIDKVLKSLMTKTFRQRLIISSEQR